MCGDKYASFALVTNRENANVIISIYQNTESIGDCQVYPEIGTVAMGSALHGWGFTITTFSNMYAAKFKTNKARLRDKLWGDHYFDTKTKHWTDEPTDADGNDLPRAFCSMIIEPISSTKILSMSNQKLIPLLWESERERD